MPNKYPDTNGNGIPDAFENRRPISEILNDDAPRGWLQKVTDAVVGFRDPLPVKTLGDIETKASAIQPADQRPDLGRYAYDANWNNSWAYQWPNYRTANYRRDMGRLDGSSLVMAAVNYTGISLAEALPIVTKPDRDGAQQPELQHPCSDLIRRPNPFHTWAHYCLAGAFDWWMGNWYFQKVRNITGQVIELWWLPQMLIEPRWPGDGKSPVVPLEEVENTFLSHYQYNIPGRQPVLIKQRDMLHFKRGVNLDNPRKGAGVWDAVLEELYGDGAVARFSATIMRNMGMVQYLLSPKDPSITVSPEQAMAIKQKWILNSTGENANTPMVNPVPLEATKLSFSPDELDLSELRKVPESRIAGVTGIPAIVLQSLAGLEHGHYGAAYEQARQQGYENVIIPIQNHLAEDFTWQLLPELDKTAGAKVSFDISKVRVLQEDRDALYRRESEALRAGGITFDQYLTSLGKPPLGPPLGDIRLIPSTSSPMTPERMDAVATGAVQQPQQPPIDPATLAKFADVDQYLESLERQMKEFVGK